MFDDLINDFAVTVYGLSKTLPFTEVMIDKIANTKTKNLTKFVEEKCKRDDKDERKYTIPWERIREFNRIRNELDEIIIAKTAVSNSFIVTLISQYDVLIADLIREVYKQRPEILLISEKTVKLNELLEMKSIEEAKMSVIEKEVDSILRGSHIDELEWFEKKLGCEILKDKEIICKFVELTERRNLCVHSNCRVTSQYLQLCNDYDYPIESCIKIGDRIDVDTEYFNKAIDIVLEISIKLVHFIWFKLKKDEEIQIIKNMNDCIYWMIFNKRYATAIKTIEYAERMFSKKMSSEQSFIIKYNLAQSYYWIGDQKKKDEIIDKIDISAASNRYLLPYYALKEDFTRCSEIMIDIGTTREITAEEYLEWPILTKLRETPLFNSTYESIFGVSFTINDNKQEKEEVDSLQQDLQLS